LENYKERGSITAPPSLEVKSSISGVKSGTSILLIGLTKGASPIDCGSNIRTGTIIGSRSLSIFYKLISDPDTSNFVIATHINQGWSNLAAIWSGNWTTRMEMAAGWWVKRAGHLSLQDNLLALLLNGAVRYRYGRY